MTSNKPNPSIDFDYARAIEVAHGIYAPAELKDEQCAKCKGLGYYDEGHENDDGTMSGGNYVECDKCKPS